MYDDPEYANSRLARTIVRLEKNDEPIMVEHIDLDMVVTYWTLVDEKLDHCELDGLNLKPVKLGFATTPKGLTYLARMPMRGDYRQGLRRNNYGSIWGADARWVTNVALRNTIMGNYSRLDLMIDESYNLGIPLPINRNFAVGPHLEDNKTPSLYYKWFGCVGDIVNDKFQLYDRFQFLNELMQEEFEQHDDLKGL